MIHRLTRVSILLGTTLLAVACGGTQKNSGSQQSAGLASEVNRDRLSASDDRENLVLKVRDNFIPKFSGRHLGGRDCRGPIAFYEMTAEHPIQAISVSITGTSVIDRNQSYSHFYLGFGDSSYGEELVKFEESEKRISITVRGKPTDNGRPSYQREYTKLTINILEQDQDGSPKRRISIVSWDTVLGVPVKHKVSECTFTFR